MLGSDCSAHIHEIYYQVALVKEYFCNKYFLHIVENSRFFLDQDVGNLFANLLCKYLMMPS
jgi:hypothetical protein